MKVRQKITLGLCFFYVFCVIGLSMSLHFYGDRNAAVKCKPQEKCETFKAPEQSPSVKEAVLPTSTGIISFLGPVISAFVQSLMPALFSYQHHQPLPGASVLQEANA